MRIPTSRTLLLATVAFCSAEFVVPAFAQEMPEHDSQASGAADRGDVIVVTARRREENLQSVPVTVTAFTGDMWSEPRVLR